MQLFFSGEDSERELQSELSEVFSGAQIRKAGPLLFRTEFAIPTHHRLPHLAFARQWLPDAQLLRANSIREWADAVGSATVGRVQDDQPWGLHVVPHYGAYSVPRIGARAWHTRRLQLRPPSRGGSVAEMTLAPTRKVHSEAGRHRCQLIRHSVSELLQDRRRRLRRHLHDEPAAFSPDHSLVQLWLTGPASGFLSIARAPLPFQQRHLLSPFLKGEVPVGSDKAAPSRAFAKLVEAELRLGRAIRAGETCADLGAAPGSWSFVAIQRGARVQAVDRSPLRQDLMRHPNIEFRCGDAFRFTPRYPVEWLLCDVIAAPERTAELLLNWLRCRQCARFIVTLKMQQSTVSEALGRLKRELPHLTSEFYLQHLNANKNEVCAFGVAN